MAAGIQVTGVEKVIRTLAAKIKEVGKSPQVVVGYSAPHAVKVHEDLEAFHTSGQAKFLEEPARVMEPQMAAEIVEGIQSGRPLQEVLLAAGEKLQAASQALCPVQTGALRDSAFTRIDR